MRHANERGSTAVLLRQYSHDWLFLRLWLYLTVSGSFDTIRASVALDADENGVEDRTRPGKRVCTSTSE